MGTETKSVGRAAWSYYKDPAGGITFEHVDEVGNIDYDTMKLSVVVDNLNRLESDRDALLDACRRFEAAVGFMVAGLPANHAVAKDLIGLREVARAAIAKAEGGAA